MKVRALGSILVAALCLALAACGSSGDKSLGGGGGSTTGGSSGGTIKIGASVPLSGALAGFGSFVKWGYQHAVDQANAAGGVTVDGKKKKIKLFILHDK